MTFRFVVRRCPISGLEDAELELIFRKVLFKQRCLGPLRPPLSPCTLIGLPGRLLHARCRHPSYGSAGPCQDRAVPQVDGAAARLQAVGADVEAAIFDMGVRKH